MKRYEKKTHTETVGVPIVISMKDIKRLKDILYEGQVIKCKKPYTRSESNVDFIDCTARIIRKFEHHVQLEDLDLHARSRRVFTLQYVDLIGGFTDNG